MRIFKRPQRDSPVQLRLKPTARTKGRIPDGQCVFKPVNFTQKCRDPRGP